MNGEAMFLICFASVLTCSAAEFSVILPSAPVSALVGSSVILPCGLSPALNARTFEVRWYKNVVFQNLVLLYKEQNIQENVGDNQNMNRVSLIGELEKGNVSLKLDDLRLIDGGEYFCFVKSVIWYEKGSVTLEVKAIGSTPVLSNHEAGEKMNVTCTSDGWTPKPMVIWRDSAGREPTNSHTFYTSDSEGLVSVSSWLLLSPPESDWISCTVGLNHQEIKESRILPLKGKAGFWRDAFISTLVLSLIVLITFTVLLILFRKGFLPHCSSHKNAKAAGTAHSHESLPPEMFPLHSTEKTSQGISSSFEAQPSAEEPFRSRFEGISSSPEPQPEKSFKAGLQEIKLTLDPSTAPGSLKVSTDCRSVSCKKPSRDSKRKFPYVVSKEELGSATCYWEVMIWDRTSSSKRKSSWSVGVIEKSQSEKEMIRALCYEGDSKVSPNTDQSNKIPIDYTMTRLGLMFSNEKKVLSFFNADKTSENFLYAFKDVPDGRYFAYFSPGVEDQHPIRILHEHEHK